MEEKKLINIKPPAEVFEDNGKQLYPQPAKIEASTIMTPVTNIEYPPEGGILCYHEGFKYPSKQFPFQEAMVSIDLAKRLIISLVRLMGEMPKNLKQGKIVEPITDAITLYTDHIFHRMGTYWKPRFYCDMMREVYKTGMIMSGKNETGQRLIKTICMIFEFDDAYRYRLQDIMGEFDLKFYNQNPSKELQRILTIAQSRDGEEVKGSGTANKFGYFKKIIPFMLLFPSVKKNLNEFFNKVNLEKLKLSKEDWYHCLIWVGYDFSGMTLAERMMIRGHMDAQWRQEQENEKQRNSTEQPVQR